MHPLPAFGLLLVLSACAPVALPETAGGAPTPPQRSPMALADASDIARGAAFARTKCSGCHAVGPTGASPMPGAPPLREIGQRYPVRQLAEAFAEGIVTAHPAMPEFGLTRDENRSLVAYIETLQTPGPR